MESPHISSKTTAHLTTVLSRIRAASGTVSADFLYDHPSETHVRGGYSSVSELYEPFVRLKSTRDALETLLELADSKIESLQPLFLQMGIKSLPDELLGRVFEVGYEDHDDEDCSDFAILVSGVSRHFRRVSLDSPRIWRRLNNYMTPDMLAVLIARSKNAGLHINITGAWYSRIRRPLEGFMDIVVTESQRWASFSYHRSLDYNETSILHKFPELQLPRLSSIAFRADWPDKTKARDMLDDFRHWNLPRLCHLSTVNGFIHVAADWDSLTTCTLELDADETNQTEEWDICEALLGLTALSSLESLSLQFSDIYKSKFVSSMKIPLALPHLKSLSLTFNNCNEKKFITHLVRGLHLPGLLNLSVNLDYSSHIETFLPGSNPYPSLQSLIIKGDERFSGSINLAQLVHKLPSLASVCVEGFACVRHINKFSRIESIPWQNVRLKDLCDLSDKDLTRITNALMRGHRFRTLEIINCRDISERCLRMLESRMGTQLVDEVVRYYKSTIIKPLIIE